MDRLQKFGRFSKRVINRLTKRETAEDDTDLNFTTTINEELRPISWCIENISGCPLGTGQYYESPPFYTGFSNEVKWVLRLYPKGRKTADKVGVFLCKITEDSRTDLGIKYFIRILLNSEPGEISNEKNDTYSYGNPSKTIQAIDESDGSREYGTDQLCPSKCVLQRNSILIICHFTVVYADENGCCTAGPPASSTLCGDFSAMYQSGKFSDITLQVKKRSFPVHKAILAARSEVFAAMFDHDMKESKTGVIPIDDVEPAVMNSVLQYMYCGKVGALSMDEAASIFPVADKYSLTELQQWCIGVMLAKLSAENVYQIAILADMHSVPKLKAAANYVFRKYTPQILETKEWRKLVNEKPQLASEILHAVTFNFNHSKNLLIHKSIS